jgi:O-acetyl-ADP-ribose deacetylase (regulator of RNase III)
MYYIDKVTNDHDVRYKVNDDLVEDKEIDVFCHQCNCRACMGGGIAAQIAETYPEVARRDSEYHNEVYTNNDKSTEKMLGTILPVILHDQRICINMYSQYDMGAAFPDSIEFEDPDTKSKRLEYFKSCLEQIKVFLDGPGGERLKTIGFPKYIGCGLAGGFWPNYEQAIKDFAKTVGQKVFIVSLRN